MLCVFRFARPATPEPSDTPTPEFHAALEAGARALEEGAFDQARQQYLKALTIHRDATTLFNLGVVHYCLSELSGSTIVSSSFRLTPSSPFLSHCALSFSEDHDAAISSWLESIALDPKNSDAHTSSSFSSSSFARMPTYPTSHPDYLPHFRPCVRLHYIEDPQGSPRSQAPSVSL